MKITYMELPISAHSEPEFNQVISSKPQILGKGVKILIKEFRLQGGDCDIFAKQGKVFLLVELKVWPKAKEIDVDTRGRWMGQLVKYVKSFLLLAEILGAKPDIEPYLVVAVPENRKGLKAQLEHDNASLVKQEDITDLARASLEESERFLRLKNQHTNELDRLRKEEEKLRGRNERLRDQIRGVNLETERKKAKKELMETEEDLNDAKSRLAKVKAGLGKTGIQVGKLLETTDLIDVYLSDYSGHGKTSTLVGKIEGDKFVWHKPYLEMIGMV